MEVLTGVAAGDLQADGFYPEGTVHYLVERQLADMARKAREFGRGKAEDADDEERDTEGESRSTTS
jgi:hypothetical protein